MRKASGGVFKGGITAPTMLKEFLKKYLEKILSESLEIFFEDYPWEMLLMKAVH